MENNKFIKFSISAGTYSINDFNAKIKVAVLQERQDWVPETYTFMTPSIFFIALGILDKHLKKTTLIKSTLPLGSYKTSLDTSPPPKSLSLHCKQINKVKNKLDDQPSLLLASMHVSSYKTTFFPMHLVLLELDTHRHHLDFEIFNENNNEVIPRTYYLQLLNKQ